MDNVLEMCAVGCRCRGICPETRRKRGQDNICPAFYEKVIAPKKEHVKYDDEDLTE